MCDDFIMFCSSRATFLRRSKTCMCDDGLRDTERCMSKEKNSREEEQRKDFVIQQESEGEKNFNFLIEFSYKSGDVIDQIEVTCTYMNMRYELCESFSNFFSSNQFDVTGIFSDVRYDMEILCISMLFRLFIFCLSDPCHSINHNM